MSKESSDHLFQLIHAMSKSEKRYFKLHATRMVRKEGKKFLHLFDRIARQKQYDEKKILRTSPHIKPAQLHNLKANLLKQILESLRLYSGPGSIDTVIRNRTEHAQILLNKGLYDQAFRMLEKAKRIAQQHERNTLLLDIIELEKNVIPHAVEAHHEERVNAVIAEARSVTRRINNINNLSNLTARLQALYKKTGFIRNRRDHEMVRNFFLSGLPAYEEHKLSFYEKLHLYASFVSYCFFIQDFRKAYRYAQRYHGLFTAEPARVLQRPELYIKGLNNLLVAENKLFLFREFEATYKLLMRVHALPGLQLTENLQIMLFKYKYMHKINQYFMMGDFSGGTKIISVAENELDRFAKRLDKHDVLLFYYKVGCLYFGAGNFKSALRWLNRIINSKDVDLREDILSFARMLNLICHYELGNIELVEYHIRSTYRFLLKKEGLYAYHRYILAFMRELGPDTQGKKLMRQFAELKKKLVPLERHPYEKRPFLYFDIISWLESKISGTSVESVIKKKFRDTMKVKG
jgi:hypothetical protein